MMRRTSFISKIHEELDYLISNSNINNLTNITRDKLNVMFSSNFSSHEEFNEYVKNLVIDKLKTIDANFNQKWKKMSSLSVIYSYNNENNLAYLNQLNPTSVLISLLFFLFLMILNIHVYKKSNISTKKKNKKKENILNGHDNLWYHYTDKITSTLSKYNPSSSSTRAVTKSNNNEMFKYQHTAFNCEAVNRIKMNVGQYEPPFWYSPILGKLRYITCHSS